MDELGVYVIRVYRQDQAGIDGMVEAVVSGEQMPFSEGTVLQLHGMLYR